MSNLMNEKDINKVDNYNNIASISQEDINPPCFDDERRYRGAHSQRLHLPLPLFYTLINSDVEFELAAIPNKSVEIKKIHIVPDAPLYLIPTHFIVNTCLDELISRVHDILGHMSGVSCEFLEAVYEVNI